jgi:hypothetical protein
MDIQGFTTGLALAKSAVDLVSGVTDLIADPTKREAAKVALEQSKKAFEIAEIQAAQSLGHLLCQCDWPTAICIKTSPAHWKCRRCGRTYSTEGKAGGGW